jgi:hypothetical protein
VKSAFRKTEAQIMRWFLRCSRERMIGLLFVIHNQSRVDEFVPSAEEREVLSSRMDMNNEE